MYDSKVIIMRVMMMMMRQVGPIKAEIYALLCALSPC